MTKSRDGRDKPFTQKPTSSNYEVGYGKPPVSSRFKAGQSGNPSGRPKGSKNRPKRAPELERLKAIILKEGYRKVTVTDAGRQITVPIAQAVVRSLAVKAVKGNSRAQRQFTDMLSSIEREKQRKWEELLQTAIKYKLDWEHELEERRLFGTTGPEPLPHPDDIVIDLHSGTIKFKGPLTKEDKVIWDRLRYLKGACDDEIREVTKLLKKDPMDLQLQGELEHAQWMRAKITKLIPD